MALSHRRLGALSATLALPALPARAQIALRDAAVRDLSLRRPAERIVRGFNLEEFSAVSGSGRCDRVVGINHRQWAINRPAV